MVWLPRLNELTYIVAGGSVQPYVARCGTREISGFMCHFGLPNYDSSRPVLSDRYRSEGQKVCDMLNSGEINECEARKLLAKIW